MTRRWGVFDEKWAELDAIWLQVAAKPYRLDEAIEQVQKLLDLTDTGAQELLTNPTRPSVRYAEVAR